MNYDQIIKQYLYKYEQCEDKYYQLLYNYPISRADKYYQLLHNYPISCADKYYQLLYNYENQIGDLYHSHITPKERTNESKSILKVVKAKMKQNKNKCKRTKKHSGQGEIKSQLKKINKKNISEDKVTMSTLECTICLSNVPKIVAQPCGHLYSCVTCHEGCKLHACPICRTNVDSHFRIYF
jgi:hypothetical protein